MTMRRDLLAPTIWVIRLAFSAALAVVTSCKAGGAASEAVAPVAATPPDVERVTAWLDALRRRDVPSLVAATRKMSVTGASSLQKCGPRRFGSAERYSAVTP
jgi:L-amino acid N-acyltransferase YncA